MTDQLSTSLTLSPLVTALATLYAPLSALLHGYRQLENRKYWQLRQQTLLAGTRRWGESSVWCSVSTVRTPPHLFPPRNSSGVSQWKKPLGETERDWLETVSCWSWTEGKRQGSLAALLLSRVRHYCCLSIPHRSPQLDLHSCHQWARPQDRHQARDSRDLCWFTRTLRGWRGPALVIYKPKNSMQPKYVKISARREKIRV